MLPVVAELFVRLITPPLPPAASPVPALPPLAVNVPADVVSVPLDVTVMLPAWPPAWFATPLPLLPEVVMAPVVVTVRPERLTDSTIGAGRPGERGTAGCLDGGGRRKLQSTLR